MFEPRAELITNSSKNQEQGQPSLNDIINLDVSKNTGFSPQLIHFNEVFRYFHHPFWGTTILGNPHLYLVIKHNSEYHVYGLADPNPPQFPLLRDRHPPKTTNKCIPPPPPPPPKKRKTFHKRKAHQQLAFENRPGPKIENRSYSFAIHFQVQTVSVREGIILLIVQKSGDHHLGCIFI